jgi:hypothetical protein
MALKRVVVGVTALAVVGGGTGYALAESSHASTDLAAVTTSPSSSPSSGQTHPNGKHRGLRHRALLRLRTLQHAEWVTRDPNTNKDVTHEAVLGTVTSVSATSITVKAADGYTLTFAVNSDTKVHLGKGKTGKVTDIKSGGKALVVGVKSGSTVTAQQVLARTS